jgi:hypothetical protein
MTNSDWNSNTGVNQLNGDPKPVSRQQALPDLHAESGALHVIG